MSTLYHEIAETLLPWQIKCPSFLQWRESRRKRVNPVSQDFCLRGNDDERTIRW